MTGRYFVIGLFFSVLFTSCEKQNSADVNQQSIYTIYQLMYDENDDVTTARGTFRFGGEIGTLLELTDPAACWFESEQLDYNAVFGYHEAEFAGYVSNGTFEYEDQDFNSYVNFAGTMDPIGFNATDSISKSSDFEYIWTGSPLGANETVSVVINSPSSSSNETFTTIAEGDTSIVLKATKLDNFGTGNATFTLKRTYNQSTLDQGTNKGGRIAVSYEVSADIYIKD